MSQRQAARAIGVHDSTVSRELRSHAPPEGYDPEQAQQRSDHRRRTAWKWTKRLPSLMDFVARRIREEWSPEQISGFMAPLIGVGVSHQWIYSLIWDDKARRGALWRHLRQPRRRSKHRAWAKSAGLGRTPHRVGIEHRLAEVEERRFIGHWESDTVIQGHKQSGLVTLVERRSGYLLAARLPRVSADLTQEAMIRLLKPRCGAVKTITHGQWLRIRQSRRRWPGGERRYLLLCPCSGQRGSNENTNGLVRQYFPKGTDFRQVTDAELRRVVRMLNDRPRKRLGYRTPAQVFLGEYSGALDTAGAALIA
ncbi:IS30 family transposase [Vreelandella boliviensis]|uniref:IS30 family transposase n=1 Tax=Vreelandella boliviensis TaxID=223527 RepID=UPI001B8D8566|nr:IS30 family transposase [Halomonas boliviensis]MBS3670005.1 IS30 family transposase [Halomonas boliviensis]